MNIEHQLSDELARAAGPAITSGTDLRTAAAALRDNRSGTRSVAGAVLHRVATCRDLAATIAADSYWHSNGFAKLNLVRRRRPERRLRLHVWPGASRGTWPVPGYENVHGHRWAFASVVLCGELHVVEFEETGLDDPKAQVVQKFAYITPAGALTGELHPLGSRALRRIASFAYAAGDVHSCDTTVVHNVQADEAVLTATMVVQGPAERDDAPVYQRTDHEVLQDTGVPLTTDEVTELALTTLATMPENGRT